MNMISDNLWNRIKTVIPSKASKVGRPQNDTRATLIKRHFYIMVTGAQWHKLPIYYGKPTKVHGRPMLWVRSRIFNKILDESINYAIEILRLPKSFIIDTSFSKSPFAKFDGKNQTDRTKSGIKKEIVIDMNRIILSVIIDSDNRHDSKLLLIPHLHSIKKFVVVLSS